MNNAINKLIALLLLLQAPAASAQSLTVTQLPDAFKNPEKYKARSVEGDTALDSSATFTKYFFDGGLLIYVSDVNKNERGIWIDTEYPEKFIKGEKVLARVQNKEDDVTLALITAGPFKDLYVTHLPRWGSLGVIDISTPDFMNKEELQGINRFPNEPERYTLRRYLSNKDAFCQMPGVTCY